VVRRARLARLGTIDFTDLNPAKCLATRKGLEEATEECGAVHASNPPIIILQINKLHWIFRSGWPRQTRRRERSEGIQRFKTTYIDILGSQCYLETRSSQ